MEELLMSFISANPNATNSELDAKQIVTVKELTDSQRGELIEQYVESVSYTHLTLPTIYSV